MVLAAEHWEPENTHLLVVESQQLSWHGVPVAQHDSPGSPHKPPPSKLAVAQELTTMPLMVALCDPCAQLIEQLEPLTLTEQLAPLSDSDPQKQRDEPPKLPEQQPSLEPPEQEAAARVAPRRAIRRHAV
jgi:hypothetical protein